MTDSILAVVATITKIVAIVKPFKFLNLIVKYKEVNAIAKEKISLWNVVEYNIKIGRKLIKNAPANAKRGEKKFLVIK